MNKNSDKMFETLVTVIIPTFNRPELLDRAVNSVLNQTYANLEVIIADDASGEPTVDVCEILKKKDARVRVFRSQENIGAAAVRNRALDISRGGYICYLDDDDVWLPEKIFVQLNYIEDYSIVACLSKRVDGYAMAGGLEIKKGINLNKVRMSGPKVESKTLNDIFFNNGNISPSCIMVKRNHLVELGGFDESLPSSQGRDLFVRLVNSFGEALLINEYLAAHYQRHGLPRITTSKRSLVGGWMELEKHKHLMPRRLVAWRTYMLCIKEAGLSKSYREKIYWVSKSLIHVRPFHLLDQLKVLVANLFLR